jgi:hypothetical protein
VAQKKELVMSLDLQSARFSELTVTVDFKPAPTQREDEKIMWATVELYYDLAGRMPDVSVHVPLQWREEMSADAIKVEALHSARDLLGRALSAPIFATVPQAIQYFCLQTAA